MPGRRRIRASHALVERVLQLIRNLRDGRYLGKRLLIKKRLTAAEYILLLDRIAAEPRLRAYFEDKLR